MITNLADNKYFGTINNWQVIAPVSACMPSLSVVSFNQSLLPALLNNNILTSYFLASDPTSAAKPLADTVVTAATATFIALGVNRWASLYIINPKAYGEFNDIPNYYAFKDAEGLQNIAGQYFYDYTAISDDLITMEEETFKTLLLPKIDTNNLIMPTILMGGLGYSLNDVQSTAYIDRKNICVNYLWQNTLQLQNHIKTTWDTTYTTNSAVTGSFNIGL